MATLPALAANTTESAVGFRLFYGSIPGSAPFNPGATAAVMTTELTVIRKITLPDSKQIEYDNTRIDQAPATAAKSTGFGIHDADRIKVTLASDSAGTKRTAINAIRGVEKLFTLVYPNGNAETWIGAVTKDPSQTDGKGETVLEVEIVLNSTPVATAAASVYA